MTVKIQLRRGTAAEWTSANPTLLSGEQGLETDTGKTKIGDGVTAWNSLGYAFVQNALISGTKGAVPVGTGSTVAALSPGSNGQTLVADSAATTGLRWQPTQAAGRNFLLNSDFSIWQRGTSSTDGNGAGKFIADRWQHYSGTTGRTYSRQTTSDTTNLPQIQHCFRVARDSGNSATNQVSIWQTLDNATFRPLAGQSFVLSFYARRGANFSGPSNNLDVSCASGTGTDENGGWSGFTGESAVTLTGGPFTLTTTWQRFSATGTFAATATQCFFRFAFTPAGTAGAADYFEVTGIQLEVGSTATAFRTATGNPASELAACQRYYYRLEPGASNDPLGIGWNLTTTTSIVHTPFPVTMRVKPTALEQSGTAGHYRINHGNTATTCSAVPTFNAVSLDGAAVVFTVGSGLTAGQGSGGRTETSSGYLAWSAEL